MKKFLFLLLVGFVGMYSYANNDQGGDINQTDSEGRKQGKWVFLGKDRPTSGYPEDGKIEEGPYVDDRKEGTWIKYHNDGATPKLKGEYKNNRPSGGYTKFYADGTIREVGVFERNKYEGTLKRYHPNGQLEYESNYNEEGKEEGTVKYYYANGQAEFVYDSRDGVPSGKATRYYENGDVKEIITYGANGQVEKSEAREMFRSLG